MPWNPQDILQSLYVPSLMPTSGHSHHPVETRVCNMSLVIINRIV